LFNIVFVFAVRLQHFNMTIIFKYPFKILFTFYPFTVANDSLTLTFNDTMVQTILK